VKKILENVDRREQRKQNTYLLGKAVVSVCMNTCKFVTLLVGVTCLHKIRVKMPKNVKQSSELGFQKLRATADNQGSEIVSEVLDKQIFSEHSSVSARRVKQSHTPSDEALRQFNISARFPFSLPHNPVKLKKSN